MTTRPSAGPTSAYPTFRTPASICFSTPNDVFVPGISGGTVAGFVMLDCARADPMPRWAAAKAVIAPDAARKPRRVGNDDFGEAPSSIGAIGNLLGTMPRRAMHSAYCFKYSNRGRRQ